MGKKLAPVTKNQILKYIFIIKIFYYYFKQFAIIFLINLNLILLFAILSSDSSGFNKEKRPNNHSEIKQDLNKNESKIEEIKENLFLGGDLE